MFNRRIYFERLLADCACTFSNDDILADHEKSLDFLVYFELVSNLCFYGRAWGHHQFVHSSDDDWLYYSIGLVGFDSL